jgi:small subunit ribosomal protein S1
VGELVYGRVTKLVPFGAFVQVGDGIEGLVHISEMSAHHVDLPDQVVTPGEELWVKIIDLDLARRRISLSIKQAAEGGELAEEYREHFEVDEHGNWTSGNPDEVEAAWAEYQSSETPEAAETTDAAPPAADAAEAPVATETPDVAADEPEAAPEVAAADEPEPVTEVAEAEEPAAVDATVAAEEPDA